MVLYYLIDRKKRFILTLLAVMVAIFFNGLFSFLNDLFNSPIFLDSAFTIMIAALFGLWPAMAVGLLTNCFIELLNGFPGIYWPFTIVNLITALTTSIFVIRKKFENSTNAFWLIIVLSVLNSLVGALLVTFLFGGYTNLSMDNMVKGITVTGQSLLTSTFYVRLVVNIVDKGIPVIITFFLYKFIQLKAEKKI